MGSRKETPEYILAQIPGAKLTHDVRAVGIPWIRKEDYAALRSIFKDGNKMPATWEKWLKRSEQSEQRLQADGYIVERVYIDPDTFPDWCAREGVTVDRQGRNKFVATTVSRKYRNQS